MEGGILKVIVLSLFDGISCGMEAFKRINIKIDKYYSSEIDKYAIQVSRNNHPEIIQLGDINNWKSWNIKKPDLILAGCPCQGFSFAGKQLAFNDPRSKLFFKFVDILNFYNPKYFLLENVRMKKEYQNIISEYLKVEPVLINSALLSAQNRNRLYWANFEISQPKDKGIFLKDIIENGIVNRDKSYCIDASYFKGTSEDIYFNRKRRQAVFSIASRGRNLVDNKRVDIKGAKTSQRFETKYNKKSNCLTSVQKDSYIVENLIIRKLSPLECERLQTLKDDYTLGISNTQRYKLLGNCWTVDIISHILKDGLKYKNDKE